jgi:hypothetical protein
MGEKLAWPLAAAAILGLSAACWILLGEAINLLV